MSYLYLAFAVAFNAGSYAVFKSIATRPHGNVWYALFAVGMALGTVNTICFNAALRELKLGVAYPIFSGASFTTVLLLSALVFGESLTRTNLIGAGLVIAGIVVMTR